MVEVVSKADPLAPKVRLFKPNEPATTLLASPSCWLGNSVQEPVRREFRAETPTFKEWAVSLGSFRFEQETE